ncbi:MAG TPA: hypothetical protein VE262_02295 [Blastocatellia bacterium]|nr:hypothetical protein [Blastocatellia bacterium]
MAISNNLFISVSPIVQKLIITSGMKLSAQSSVESIASQLCAAAESLYLKRDYDSLSQVADVLCSLPHEGARAAGMLFKARSLFSVNRNDEQVIKLLESASESKAAPRISTRALQSLGVVCRYNGDIREAARLYNRSIERAASAHSADLVTVVNATLARSEIISTEGDHGRALDELRAVKPAVELLAQVYPVYAPMLANEVAFELLQTGRIEDARNFALYALASPFAPRFPNWAETAQEIEQAKESKAAHNQIVRAEAAPVRSTARKRTPRTLFLVLKLSLKAPRRRSQPRRAIFTRALPRSRPTLEQVSLKIKIRAPSF